MGRRSPLFAVPAFVIYTALLIVPIAIAFYFSFTDWNGIVTNRMNWIGARNFEAMLRDDRLWNAVKVTLTIVVSVTLAVNALGLAFALLLNKAGKLTNVLRSVFFVPFILSTVAVSFIWITILSYTGVLNTVLASIGLESLQTDYIGNTNRAIISLIVIETWKTMGFNMVILLAALQTVPEELYEACTIDGGGRWSKFRNVTLPLIVPGLTISVLMTVMSEMRQFDLVKVITDGGPGTSTETVTYNIITQAFGNNMLGYASAIALVLFIVIIGVSILQIALSRRMEVER